MQMIIHLREETIMEGMLRKDIFDGTDANVGVTARYGSTKARIERAASESCCTE